MSERNDQLSTTVSRAIEMLLGVTHRSRKDAAEALGIDPSGITKRFQKNSWTFDEVAVLAAWFDVPTSAFIDRHELAKAVAYLAEHASPCITAQLALAFA